MMMNYNAPSLQISSRFTRDERTKKIMSYQYFPFVPSIRRVLNDCGAIRMKDDGECSEGYLHRILQIMPIVMWVFSLSATDSNALFEKGCAAYEKKEYGTAHRAWNSITPKNPAIWFNLGSAAYALQNREEALIYWLRAYCQGAGAVSEASRAVLEKELNQRETSLSLLHELKPLPIPLLGWQLGFLLFLMILLLVVHMAWWHRYVLIVVVLGLLTMAVGVGVTYHEQWYPRALVIKEQVTLYAGPDEQFQKVVAIPPLSVVRVLSCSQGWYKVRYGCHVGWAVGTTVALLDTDH